MLHSTNCFKLKNTVCIKKTGSDKIKNTSKMELIFLKDKKMFFF